MRTSVCRDGGGGAFRRTESVFLSRIQAGLKTTCPVAQGDKPLEIITTRQWYIRNGGRDEALRKDLIKRGHELAWHPEHMHVRYDNWVRGLNGDWLVSRQRYFGVPVPVWYRLDSEGAPDYAQPLAPDESLLPIDPQSDVPPGYDEDQRNQPSGFMGDPDIMDTWATSSLTPQIATGWEDDPDLFVRTFPMDMRPQAHEIIRTWLFSTVVRSHFEHGCVPWDNVVLSGWILYPDRKKMSKSKGNVITPMGLLESYGSDGVRYWAASGRLGTDTAFEEKQMKIGRRLAVKMMNASKFALGFGGDPNGVITEPLDTAMLAKLAALVDEATSSLEKFDYTRALERTEGFFWWFCDDYLELVKGRAYGEGDGASSARNALCIGLSTIQRLFAPFLPFVTEE
ncbi:MAG TPA: valine--tRNA ligase, partial [Gammaproteobacteria bacterium]|nr:valine--tRNA ligase [Gammaproteobacteria bacterium]